MTIRDDPLTYILKHKHSARSSRVSPMFCCEKNLVGKSVCCSANITYVIRPDGFPAYSVSHYMIHIDVRRSLPLNLLLIILIAPSLSACILALYSMGCIMNVLHLGQNCSSITTSVNAIHSNLCAAAAVTIFTRENQLIVPIFRILTRLRKLRNACPSMLRPYFNQLAASYPTNHPRMSTKVRNSIQKLQCRQNRLLVCGPRVIAEMGEVVCRARQVEPRHGGDQHQ